MAVVALVTAQGNLEPNGPRLQVVLANHRSFVITTDPRNSPKSVKMVLGLVRAHFYDGLKIHRVERWVIQWGDPQSRTLAINDHRMGSKGSGKTLPFEAPKYRFVRGTVGLASAYDGVGGDGQLFVLTKDAPRLNGGFGILGKVTEGMNVVDTIRLGDRIEQIKILPGH